VLVKRLNDVGCPHRGLVSPVPVEAVLRMRLDAVVIDLAVLGPQAWSYLGELCERIPPSALRRSTCRSIARDGAG
jgi:hypothetical protein